MASATARLIAQNPLCCFCGGTEAAVSMDHQPARVMFPDRHRPKGLEFPACSVCNGQTSADEALVGFFARVTGNHRYKNSASDKALTGAVKAVTRSFPLLLPQIVRPVLVNENGILRKRLSVNGNHKQVGLSACRVAAKLGLAAYYELFGSSAPTTVKINTMWTHNQNQNTALAVHNLLGKMPGTLHLQQGKKWDTQGTFFFRYFTEADVFTTAAVLHESLVLMADIRPSANTIGWESWHHVWVPVPGKGIQQALPSLPGSST